MKNLIFTLLILFAACSQGKDRKLMSALDFAGQNRAELEEVLAHYKNEPEKLAAARFLIENMPYHYYVYNNDLSNLNTKLRQMVEEEKLSSQKVSDYLSKLNTHRMLFKKDIRNDAKTITADYLIKNIDLAFKTREGQPWGKHIPFETFCEEILPYRIDNEIPDNWREAFYNYYQPVLDSLLRDTSPLSACRILYDTIDRQNWNFVENFQLPHVGGEVLLNHRIGNCREYSDYALYAMRALGIPGGIDMILQNPDHMYKTHYWNYVTDTAGKHTEFELYSYRPSSEPAEISRKRGCVYRLCFSLQEKSVPMLYPEKNIPLHLKNPFLSNVTPKYFPNCEIRLPVSKRDIKDNLLYLCVFNNTEWIPVCCTDIKNGEALFSGIEPGVFYFPAYYIDGNIQPAGDPFIQKTDNSLHFQIPDTVNRYEITLKTKFRPHTYLYGVGKWAIGGKFQGANRADFKDAVTFHTIEQELGLIYYEANVSLPQKFRYVRYLSPVSSHCNMAEVEFYSENENLLKGDIIGSEGFSGDNPALGKQALYDGDPLTYFFAKNVSGDWSGMDLKSEYPVKRIRYRFKNDDNTIREGDLYELFYFSKEGGCISLGKQYGDKKQFLTYNNVPENALLWLHNHTRGNEERIFTYVDGVPVWW